MEYFLNERQKMIKSLARRIAEEKILPVRVELDESEEFPWGVMKDLADSDMFRVFIPEEYDGVVIDIASGDRETDDDGEFTSTIIIPESTADAHTITVTDESGNEPEAEFSVKPKITIDPNSGTVDEVIQVSDTGWGDKAG